jgi:hypothetical protein
MNAEINVDTDVIGKCDPYVTIECGAKPDKNGHFHSGSGPKKNKKKGKKEDVVEGIGKTKVDRTEVKKNTQNPVWNAEFEYKVRPSRLHTTHYTLHTTHYTLHPEP